MIVDTNANLSRWPFRRTPCDELPRLVETFLRHGIGQAWVGSLDGLFHRDVAGVNRRLVDACRRERRVEMLPFGTINPRLPDWEEEMRRCDEEYGMRGIRLHPNFHGYELDAPEFGRLLDLASERNLIVQLAVRMDDVRVQHPLMQVADVDPKLLPEQVRARPSLRVVLLNSLMTLRRAAIAPLSGVRQIHFDIGMQEGIGGIQRLLDHVSLPQVLFGSHLPLFPLESALFKLRESPLDDWHVRAIQHENAERLLARE